MNLDQTQIHEISHIFGCPVGSFPMKYLGVALHFDKLKREEVQPLIDKVLKKKVAGEGGFFLQLLECAY